MTLPGSLRASVTAWLADDPDPLTRAELRTVLAAADGGDDQAVADLEDRFSGLLEFGTAGLRGALGAGPHRMNRAVVLRAAAGLTAYLQSECAIAEPMVVVGFDARHRSDDFARDTARPSSSGRAVARRCCPIPCRPRCWRSRSVISGPTPG